jgi:glycosyltransferase involved in cell wall biosynthesis
MTVPKVSVLITTYNVDAYIGEALDSVLAQRTDFPVEIVINDDASTDGTQRIIRAYAARHPEIIRPFFQPYNKGATPNTADCYHRCTGEYVALLDGDDYWTDPEKLSKQVALLDQNPEYAVCFTGSRRLPQKNPDAPGTGTQLTFTLEDFLRRDYMMATSTVMYRRALLPILPPEYCVQWGTDFYLHVLFAMRGLIGYIDEVTAVYRSRPMSETSKPGSVQRTLGLLQMRLDVDALLQYKYHRTMRFLRRYFDVAQAYLDETGDRGKARHYLVQAVRRIPYEASRDNLESVLILFLRIYFPHGYRLARAGKQLLRRGLKIARVTQSR